MQDQTQATGGPVFYLNRLLWVLTGLSGAGAVFLDAWLSHGFTSSNPDVLDSLQTAVRYQQLNTVTLALSLWMAGTLLQRGGRLRGLSLLPGVCFLLAIFAFSGGIYGKYLLGFATGNITPAGGFLMALGWLGLAYSGMCYHRR